MQDNTESTNNNNEETKKASGSKKEHVTDSKRAVLKMSVARVRRFGRTVAAEKSRRIAAVRFTALLEAIESQLLLRANFQKQKSSNLFTSHNSTNSNVITFVNLMETAKGISYINNIVQVERMAMPGSNTAGVGGGGFGTTEQQGGEELAFAGVLRGDAKPILVITNPNTTNVEVKSRESELDVLRKIHLKKPEIGDSNPYTSFFLDFGLLFSKNSSNEFLTVEDTLLEVIEQSSKGQKKAKKSTLPPPKSKNGNGASSSSSSKTPDTPTPTKKGRKRKNEEDSSVDVPLTKKTRKATDTDE